MATYPAWMEVAKVLGMGVDNILIFTVKNTVQGLVAEQGKEQEPVWVLGHVNRGVLEEVQICIRHIKDLQKAAAVSTWVLNRLPPGSDKVLASLGAEATVKGWCEGEGGGGEARDMLEHAAKLRRQLEGEGVLRRYGLASKQYLELVQASKPLPLLTGLYEDPSVEQRQLVAAGEHPDIASAAEALATIYELDLTKIRYDLLDKWLPLSCSSGPSADDTMADFSLDLNVKEQEGGGGDDANLLRCCYLLQSGGREDGLQYLLKYAFSEEPTVTSSHRQRALQCLLSCCGDQELCQATGRSLASLQDTLRRLVFQGRLETLGLAYSPELLTQASGPQLVEGVWRSCKTSPQGVTLVRDLCAEFGVWAPQLWAALLDQMVAFNMVPELRAALRLLNRQPHLWHVPQVAQAADNLEFFYLA